MRTLLGVGLVSSGLLGLAPWSPPRNQDQGRRCQLEVIHVAREGVQTNVGPGSTNYFAGGDVHMACRGQKVDMWADSVASYQGQVVQFVGNVRYVDEDRRLTSDFGTYYKANEWWQATGRVEYTNLTDGSTIKGPVLNYYRKLKGQRELEEVLGEQRPTLTLVTKDSTTVRPEPYVVVGDRIRMRGEDLMWAGGQVTIDRSDLRGRGDSLQLDTGKAGTGNLIGHASLRRAATDTFTLAGKQIDLALAKKELTGVTGRDSATLVSKDLDLNAATIRLVLTDRKVTQTLAWGAKPRPKALSDDFEVRGDSLAVDSPGEQLKELRSYRGAWVGFKPDSAKGDRDQLWGDTIVARFEPRQTPTGPKTGLQELEGRGGASSLYRQANEKVPGGPPTINYATAGRILLVMQQGDSVKVERVHMAGNVQGMQLQPAETPRPDTTKRDTAAVKPKKP